jgi:acetolactate synthase-1/2/3 large subunit
VAIAGGPAFGHYYKDAFQELDLLSMFKPVTKLAIQVNKPDRIPEILHYALRTAMTGRKGPVFIDIPRDVLNNHVLQTDIAPPRAYRPDYPSLPHPARETVRLQQAERPLMVVRGGAPGLTPTTWRYASVSSMRCP